jgi:hypothetical protein
VGNLFDELSKALARGIGRRKAMRQLVAGGAGAVAVTLLPGQTASARQLDRLTRDVCKRYCQQQIGEKSGAEFTTCYNSCYQRYRNHHPEQTRTRGSTCLVVCNGTLLDNSALNGPGLSS